MTVETIEPQESCIAADIISADKSAFEASQTVEHGDWKDMFIKRPNKFSLSQEFIAEEPSIECLIILLPLMVVGDILWTIGVYLANIALVVLWCIAAILISIIVVGVLIFMVISVVIVVCVSAIVAIAPCCIPLCIGVKLYRDYKAKQYTAVAAEA